MSEHDNVDQSFSAHTGYGGAYLTLLPGDWRLALSGGYAYSANSGTRNNPDVGLFTGGRAESDFNSHSAFVAGKFGYTASVTEILSVTPFVSASYSRIWQGEAKETGGGDFSYDVHAATAEAIVTGGLDLQGLRKQDDETAITALVALKGIGRWSAECYLLFALGRPDIMPADDLALVASAGKHLGDGTRWTPGQLRKEAEARWRPWRSAAARLLWHAYRIEAI